MLEPYCSMASLRGWRGHREHRWDAVDERVNDVHTVQLHAGPVLVLHSELHIGITSSTHHGYTANCT